MKIPFRLIFHWQKKLIRRFPSCHVLMTCYMDDPFRSKISIRITSTNTQIVRVTRYYLADSSPLSSFSCNHQFFFRIQNKTNKTLTHLEYKDLLPSPHYEYYYYYRSRIVIQFSKEIRNIFPFIIFNICTVNT